MSNRKNWKPLQPAVLDNRRDYYAAENRCFIEAHQKVYPDDTVADAIAKMDAYDKSCTYWMNDLYQVQVRRFWHDGFKQDMLHLNIRRRDGAAIFDWRHRQWIKNQLVGEECEAFEIYPAESRLVDTSNKYHLWCFANPEVRIPVSVWTAAEGQSERDVIEHEVRSPPGMRQRRV